MVITVFNAKGGVAKTTTAVNLAAALHDVGRTVAAINLDPQRNLLRFAPALTGVVVCDASGAFPDQTALAERLAAAIKAHRSRCEFILINCPPSPQECNRVALALADLAIAPVQPAILSADGVGQLQTLISGVRRDGNPSLAWRVLLTLMDTRNPNHEPVAAQIRAQLGEVVLPGAVKYSPHFDGAAIEGRAITDYSPRSHGAAAYRALAEVVDSLRGL